MQEKVKVLGIMEGSYESSNRVYSSDGLAPTLNTCGGGNLQVKIMEKVKVVGELQKGFKQVYQVISPDGLSPTLDCCMGGIDK